MNYFPQTDIHANDEKIILFMNLPGIKSSDLKVHVEDDVLVVEGERETPEGRLLLNELSPAKFKRTFKMDSGIDTQNISASLNQGLLQIEVPRTNRKRMITVTAA